MGVNDINLKNKVSIMLRESRDMTLNMTTDDVYLGVVVI